MQSAQTPSSALALKTPPLIARRLASTHLSHSVRLERFFGSRLKVVGIVDPATSRAESVLSLKRSTLAGTAYESCQIFPSIAQSIESLGVDSHPHAIFIGCPPAYRGTTDSSSGKDVECQLVAGFPSAGLLVEKPVATGPVDEVKLVGSRLVDSGVPVSVGYMLRYGAAVAKMKEIIAENKLEVMMTSARYVMGERRGVSDWYHHRHFVTDIPTISLVW